MSEQNELQTLRHTASHILAQAVKRLYPDTKLAIGPAIDTGFYYDFDSEHTFTQEDLCLLYTSIGEMSYLSNFKTVTGMG